MKRIFVAGFLLMFSFMLSAQQGGPGRGMSPEAQAQRYAQMKSEVGLNDQQLDAIKKIDEEFAPKQRELFEKFRDNREQMAAERTKLNEERNAKVKPLLSAEQFTKYVEFTNRFGGRQGGGGGGNRTN
jgi:hypothetical protein